MGRFRIAVISLLLTGACLAQSNLPFKLVGEHLIVVQGSLGDLQKRNFVIDTGAYPSIIDTGVARKLHIAGHSEELDAVNHELSRPVVVVSSIDVGPIHAQGVRAMTADLSAASQAFGTHIDALIGLDVLQHSSFQIDYRAKRIFFSEVETLPYSVPFRWNEGMLTISLQANSGTLRMLVDTGAQSTLLLASQLAVSSRGHNREFANLGGTFSLREVKLESVQLGDVELGSQAVYVSDAPDLPPYPFDGFLSTIQFEQIAFNFERRTFSWSTRAASNHHVHLASRESAAAMLGALSAGLGEGKPAGLGRTP